MARAYASSCEVSMARTGGRNAARERPRRPACGARRERHTTPAAELLPVACVDSVSERNIPPRGLAFHRSQVARLDTRLLASGPQGCHVAPLLDAVPPTDRCRRLYTSLGERTQLVLDGGHLLLTAADHCFGEPDGVDERAKLI